MPMVGAWVYSQNPNDKIFLEIEGGIVSMGRKSAYHKGSGSGWEWLEVSTE